MESDRNSRSRLGKVYFVGAGPGDPGLITVRGVDCLRQADLVLYDYLVNPAILRHCPPGAELINLGHQHTPLEDRQKHINAQVVQAARQGKIVVRLKSGDPYVFGRSGEEVAAVREAGIPFEVVPGITAALAAAGYAEIPITHAQHASAVALITGHQRKADRGRPLDYGRLASFPGTLVFYMGLNSAAQWSQALIEHGKPARTPVAVVRRGSWPDQKVIRSTLGEVAAAIAAHQVRPPAVVVVGEVVDLAPAVSWFAALPLVGRRVLVTRPSGQADQLSERLASLGAEVLQQPAVEIADPPDWQPVDEALTRLDQFDWLVFSSANGVRYLLDRLLATGGDLRRLGKVRLAAIGPGTAAALAAYCLRADLVPEDYRAEGLLESLRGQAQGKRFLLARASRGRQVLAEGLSAAGGYVEQLVVYSSIDVETADPAIYTELAAGRIDWVTVTSSAIARSLVRLFGQQLHRARLASISPVTSAVLNELGFRPAAEARQYTMDGLLDAILAQEAGDSAQ